VYAPPNCFEYGAVLRKFYQDNQFQFGDSSPTWYACHDFTTNLTEIPITPFVNLFPNPFHTSALLQFDEVVTNAELKIYNSFGQQIRKQTKIQNSIIINRNDLENGMYFYRVTNSSGQIMIGKFLIE
jgi:hypothetical protein